MLANNYLLYLISNLFSRCKNTTVAVGRANNQLVFQANFTANWPEPFSYSGYGFKKKDAELNAMVKALEFLYNGK